MRGWLLEHIERCHVEVVARSHVNNEVVYARLLEDHFILHAAFQIEAFNRILDYLLVRLAVGLLREAFSE